MHRIFRQIFLARKNIENLLILMLFGDILFILKIGYKGEYA